MQPIPCWAFVWLLVKTLEFAIKPRWSHHPVMELDDYDAAVVTIVMAQSVIVQRFAYSPRIALHDLLQKQRTGRRTTTPRLISRITLWQRR